MHRVIIRVPIHVPSHPDLNNKAESNLLLYVYILLNKFTHIRSLPMSINTNSYGMLNQNYVKRIQDTITKSLAEYPRVMILRVDLRLPEIETGSYKSDPGIVTRFIVSLKAQIESDLLKKTACR